jgi:hypothetical protein
MKVVLLSKDLMFISRVKEVATARQREAVVVKNEAALVAALTLAGGDSKGVVLIDLEKSPLSLEVLAKVLSTVDSSMWRCVGFYSHVHVETAKQAQAVGIQEVMPRSKFVQLLPALFES